MLLEQNNLNSKQCVFSTAFALLVLTVLTLTACSPAADMTVGNPLLKPDGSQSEWVPVSSKRGRFKILMPGVPKAETNIMSSPRGTIKIYTLITETSPSFAYSIECVDWPPKMQKLGLGSSNWPLALENMRREIIGDDGKLISERQLRTNSRDTTELVLEKLNGQARIFVRIYPGDQTTYEASVVMPNKIFISPENAKAALIASNIMARFFDSIEFVK
jgi:hypothetical protein